MQVSHARRLLNVLIGLGIVALIIDEIKANHLPTHHLLHFPDETLTLNDGFFNDVRALIKRRLKDNAAIKELNSERHELNKEISLASPFDTIPKTVSYIPTPVLVENWPAISHRFGQITAVSIDPEGNPVIFHRADRYWTANSFNGTNVYHMIGDGPIKENTICTLDPITGSIKFGWGKDLFYMPHGMTIDVHGNYWITDVAMHQAFKVLKYEIK